MFLFALVNFLAAQALILAGFTWPAQAISGPGTLVAVHPLTLGWLPLLMFGGLFHPRSNRGLQPRAPGARILEALERLGAGQVADAQRRSGIPISGARGARRGHPHREGRR